MQDSRSCSLYEIANAFDLQLESLSGYLFALLFDATVPMILQLQLSIASHFSAQVFIQRFKHRGVFVEKVTPSTMRAGRSFMWSAVQAAEHAGAARRRRERRLRQWLRHERSDRRRGPLQSLPPHDVQDCSARRWWRPKLLSPKGTEDGEAETHDAPRGRRCGGGRDHPQERFSKPMEVFDGRPPGLLSWKKSRPRVSQERGQERNSAQKGDIPEIVTGLPQERDQERIVAQRVDFPGPRGAESRCPGLPGRLAPRERVQHRTVDVTRPQFLKETVETERLVQRANCGSTSPTNYGGC